MKNYFYTITSKIVKLIDSATMINLPKELKRTKLFLEWKERHLDYFVNETKIFDFETNLLPATIDASYYLNLKSSVRNLVDKYYYIDHSTSRRFLNKRKTIDKIDLPTLLHGLVLIKGNVVWMDFGFNVGCEFGGVHPALVMRKVGENILVLPIDTAKDSYVFDAKKHIVFDTILGNYSMKKRYIDIERLSRLSIHRINKSSTLGKLKSEILKEVGQKLSNFWTES